MIRAILEIALCLLVFFCLYKVVLESTSLHRFKRFYLLASLILSLVIPFLEIEITNDNPILTSTEKVTETIYETIVDAETNETIITGEEIHQTNVKKAINFSWLIVLIYCLVALLLAFRFTKNIYRLINKALSVERIPKGKAEIALLNDPIIPHNFLKYIFINADDYKNEAISEKLLTHELGHATQKHSIDILLVELLQVIFWFNPLYYFYAKAIRLNHEYLADSIVLKNHSNVAQYQLLLLQFASKKQSSELHLACLSNYSLTKKRFKMMTQQTSKIAALVRVAILIPLLVITAFAFSSSTKASELIENSTSDMIKSIESSVFQENKPEILPLAEASILRVTSDFGMRKDPISGSQKMHYGIDFSAETGKPVVATASGVIIKVENMAGGYGMHIQIKHESQYETLYAQLSEIAVQVGDKIEKGQLIGKVGSTGQSTGPHLHYEVIKDGERVDPRNYFEVERVGWDRTVTYLSVDPETQKKYGLNMVHSMVNFGFAAKFQKIVYDNSKVVFFRNGEEPFVKNLNDLTEDQVSAIKALKLPHPPLMLKRKVIQAIVDNWTDPEQFGVWIDRVRVENKEMSKYSDADFAYHSVIELKKNAKNYGIHRYQLNLTTHKKYAEDKIKSKENFEEWKRTTNALLAKLDF